MKGYILVQKGKKRPIKIALQSDDGSWVDALVFAYKKGIKDSTDIEPDEEIIPVEIGD